MSPFETLLFYLEDSANEGLEPSDVQAIHEIAPGVWMVSDLCGGKTEQDVFFDVTCAIAIEYSQTSDWLASHGLGFIGFGAWGPGLSRHKMVASWLSLNKPDSWHDIPKLVWPINAK